MSTILYKQHPCIIQLNVLYSKQAYMYMYTMYMYTYLVLCTRKFLIHIGCFLFQCIALAVAAHWCDSLISSLWNLDRMVILSFFYNNVLLPCVRNMSPYFLCFVQLCAVLLWAIIRTGGP